MARPPPQRRVYGLLGGQPGHVLVHVVGVQIEPVVNQLVGAPTRRVAARCPRGQAVRRVRRCLPLHPALVQQTAQLVGRASHG